jgi:hypothetical protein
MANNSAPSFDPNAAYAPVATSAAPPATNAALSMTNAVPSFDPKGAYAPADKSPAPGTTGVLGALNKAGEFGAGILPGAVEGMGESIQSIPWIGKKIISPEAMAAERAYFAPGSPAEKVGQATGGGAETVLEFVLGDEALKGLALADKIGLASKITKITQDSPYIGALLRHGVHAARIGTVGTAEALAKGATVPDALKTGAATGAGGELLDTAIEAVPKIINAAPKFVNPFREMLQGKSIAQAPAEAAVREGVQASTQAAGTAAPTVANKIATTPLLHSNETILDEPLKMLEQQKGAAYKAIDKEAGFDLKAERQQLKNDQYKLKQLGNTAEDQTARVKLINSITDSTQRIADAEKSVKAAGIDPKVADSINTTWQAGKDFKKVLVKNISADGTINIDAILNDSKKLRFSKFGDRLSQFMGGPQAADAYMAQLEAAQKAGVHAMKVQKFSKWLGGIVAAGGIAGAGLEAGAKIKDLLAP